MSSKTLEKRFWSKVDKNGTLPVHVSGLDQCWTWTAAICHGYGVINSCSENRLERAHRVSWLLHYGAIPEGAFVCHKCDNRACVNPSHLFLGSNHDNVTDMWNKGRGVAPPAPDPNFPPPLHIGEKHPNAKMTVELVRKMRTLAQEGMSGRTLAHIFGITPAQVSNILRHKQWRHVN